MPDLEFAHAVLVLDCDPVDDAPILDLRIRKGVRRNGVRLAVASARPSALDPNAETVLRFAPGAGEALLVGARRRARRRRGQPRRRRHRRGLERRRRCASWPTWLSRRRRGRRDPLRRAAADRPARRRGRAGAAQRRRPARAARPRGRRPARDPVGDQRPRHPRGRLRRRATARATPTSSTAARRARHRRPSPTATWRALPAARRPGAHATPTAPPGRRRWPRRADGDRARVDADATRSPSTPTSSSPPRPTRRRRARSSHPDGRVQRLRPAIGRPGSLDAGRARGLAGDRRGRAARRPRPRRARRADGLHSSSSTPSRSTPGSRSTRSAGAACAGRRPRPRRADAAPWELATLDVPPLTARDRRRRHAAPRHLALALGRAGGRPLAGRCSFMRPRQVVELSPVDADRLGVRDGDQVEVGSNGTRVRGAARLRASVPGGSVFLVAGTHERAGERAHATRSSPCAASAASRSARRPRPRSSRPPARAGRGAAERAARHPADGAAGA